MRLPTTLQKGVLIRRYKRFLAEISLQDKTTITVHCPNSGSMKGCSQPGSNVVISLSSNEKRKYPWTLEMVRENDVWIGVNTGLTNKLVHEALENSVIDDFEEIDSITSEVRVSDHSRLDFCIRHKKGGTRGATYLEVKNCSLAENGIAKFPDAVTVRGAKHLQELISLRQQGFGAAILFCVQRADATCFRPAEEIDPAYAEALRLAHAAGVRLLVYQATVTPEAVTITNALPFTL